MMKINFIQDHYFSCPPRLNIPLNLSINLTRCFPEATNIENSIHRRNFDKTLIVRHTRTGKLSHLDTKRALLRL